MNAAAFPERSIGTRYATLDAYRKSLLMHDLEFGTRYCRGASVAK
jgi:hypothetical protein